MWVIPDYQAEVQVLSGGLYLYLESNNQKQFRDSLTSAGALARALGELGGPWDLVTRRFRIHIHL